MKQFLFLSFFIVATAFISCGSDDNDDPVTPPEPVAADTLKQSYFERVAPESQPRMHIEGDILYVCTNHGLYSRDLRDAGSAWQLVGFKGEPLLDYARRGSDILALRYNQEGSYLLLSHDGGETYEDVTADIFFPNERGVMRCLAQHPTDPNTLLVSTTHQGMFLSKDFGKTWEQLTDSRSAGASFIGFHPAQPSIIYDCGETGFFSPYVTISYDGGKTWDRYMEFDIGDNCIHRPAFHPTNPDRWLAGCEGSVILSEDKGHTWNGQNYYPEDLLRSAYWYFSAFDDEHPDTVYMAGTVGDVPGSGHIKIMCSTDGGHTWNQPMTREWKKDRENLNDMLQYHDRLILYTETGIYEIPKADVIAQK